MLPAHSRTSARRSPRPRRGIALLLVTIGLVICSILTAGFLATQGTSLGIARNERDAEGARAVAQSGIEMGLWLVKNRSDWRTAMSPGTWLNAVSVAGGTVTLTVADGDSTGSFSDDPRQSAILTSVGTCNGRTYTLAATVTPTGGGTVFQGGNFFSGAVLLGHDGTATDVVDSYNSSLAAYSSSAPGTNAIIWSNQNAANSIILNGWTLYRGTAMVGPSADLGTAVVAQNSHTVGPTRTAAAGQTRYSGTTILPNATNTLGNRGALNKTGGGSTVSANALYSSMTLNTSSFATSVFFNSSGIVRCTGNLTINGSTTLGVQDGYNVTLEVDGNISISGNIQLIGSGTLTIVANNGVTIKNSAFVNVNSTTSVPGTPAQCIIMGTPNCSQVNIQNSALVSAAIYAPFADIDMSSTSTVLYGAAVGKSFTIDFGGQFHFDEALKSLQLHNIYGGSAPRTGTADYTIKISEGGSLASSTTPPTVTIVTP